MAVIVCSVVGDTVWNRSTPLTVSAGYFRLCPVTFGNPVSMGSVLGVRDFSKQSLPVG